MTRTHARSPQGERAEVSEPFNQGSNISVIGSLSLSGVGPTMSIEGAVDTQVFDAYVEHFLVPTLLPGDKLRQQLRRETKVEASISTIWRGLERIEFSTKKRPSSRKRPTR
jgi:hypothetical protein